MTDKYSIEVSLSETTPLSTLPSHIPKRLWEYALAFFQVGRKHVNFVWLVNKQWLDVTLMSDRSATSLRQPKTVTVHISPTELPRGVTPREFDVLTLVALGLTNGSIAQKLGTSVRTVSTQLEQLFFKLEQTSRGGLAALAVDSGLLRLPIPGGAPETGGIGVTDLELAVLEQLDEHYTPIRTYRSQRSPIPLGLVVPAGPGVGGDGEQLQRGCMLAIAEINEQGGVGGRPLELVEAHVEMFNWQSVKNGLEQLFTAEVAAICTSYVNAEHPHFLDLIADYGRPFLHNAAFDADVLRTKSDPFRYSAVLQTCASEVHYGSGMLRFLLSLEQTGLWRAKNRRIISIEQAAQSMHLASSAFVADAHASGWEVADTIVTPLGTTRWKEVIELAKEAEPDVLFVANFLEDELVAFQQALINDPIPALVYAVYVPSVPSFAERLGADAHGVVWATTTGSYDDEIGRQFRRKYAARFGEEPGWSQAGAAYDQVRLLAAAWAAVDPAQTSEVVKYLRRWPHRGINGIYYFGEHGHEPLLYPDTTTDAALSQAHLVYQIQAGKQVLLAPEPFGSVDDFCTPAWVE